MISSYHSEISLHCMLPRDLALNQMVHIHSLYIQQTRWISFFKLTSHRVNDGGVRTLSSSPFSEMLAAPRQVLQCLVSLLWHVPQDNPHRRCQLQLVTLQEALDRLLEIKGKSSSYIAPISLEKNTFTNKFVLYYFWNWYVIDPHFSLLLSFHNTKIKQNMPDDHQQPCVQSLTVMWHTINSHVTYHQQSCDISSLHTWWSSTAMWQQAALMGDPLYK